MNKYFIMLLAMFTSFGCASPRKQELIFFRESSKRLSPAHETTYNAIFIIKNYCSSKSCDAYIDSLIFKYYETKNYKQYLVELFKESKVTNLKNFKIRPRDFEDYSDNDHVITYRFLNGRFLSKNKFKNGKSIKKIDTVNIKITPAPPLN